VTAAHVTGQLRMEIALGTLRNCDLSRAGVTAQVNQAAVWGSTICLSLLAK
jgi:hypothetical protein